MPGKRFTKTDNIKCTVKKCKRQATWQSKNGPRCNQHNADGDKFPYDNYIQKREYHWKYVGIDIAYSEYEEKLRQQNNQCAICGMDFADLKQAPHVDHNHITGQVRSLLCPTCNRNVEVVESGKADIVQQYLRYWEGGN